MKRSPMPARTAGLARVVPLRPGQPLGRIIPLRAAGFTVTIREGAEAGRVTPLRPRPKDTIPKNVRTIVKGRDYGLCIRCSRWAEHHHHRRIKGMGGDTRPHADCPCVIISLCARDHEWAHLNRREAEAEGLIIPRATPLPGLLPVLVHGPDGRSAKAWPSCDGRWLQYEPGEPAGGAA